MPTTPRGGGGKGIRYWSRSGDDVLSAAIYANFPAPENELWIRWYARYESGFAWDGGGGPEYQKILLARDVNNTTEVIFGLAGDAIRSITQGAVSANYTSVAYYAYEANSGWPAFYPTNTSDGEWVCFEIYIKMNTDTSTPNGVSRIWVDGVLVAENEAAMFNELHPESLGGWSKLFFRGNHADPNFAGEKYIDFDDMVIYNTTPQGTDASGNAFIGLLGAPVNGLCGSQAAQVDTRSYECTAGTSANQVDGASTTTWDCVGSGGGTTDNCSAAYSSSGGGGGYGFANSAISFGGVVSSFD